MVYPGENSLCIIKLDSKNKIRENLKRNLADQKLLINLLKSDFARDTALSSEEKPEYEMQKFAETLQETS